ncbi:MAG: hypothetical protein WC455_28830 [Dehalococcoidia bacterium]
MESKPKRRRKRVAPKERQKKETLVCECCGVATDRWVEHHISYEPVVKVRICRGCHNWMHGQAPVFNHLVKREAAVNHGANARGIAPFLFASCVVDMYMRKTTPAMDPVDTRVRIIGRKDSRTTH